MSVASSSTSAAAAASTSANAAPSEPQRTDSKEVADDTPEQKTVLFVSPQVASYFVGTCFYTEEIGLGTERALAGGCAGAASRTVVSPLERLKIIQ